VTLEVLSSFFGACFHEPALGNRRAKESPTLGRALFVLQSDGSLSDGPQVDDFRHAGLAGRGGREFAGRLRPFFITVNYAYTVALDQRRVPQKVMIDRKSRIANER
jgi:hypothetical protein